MRSHSDSVTSTPPGHDTTHLSRRDCLRAAGLATAGMLAGISSGPLARIATAADQPAVDPPKGRFIDAHVHVWTPDLDQYPIDESFSREDMQPPSFTPEQLFEHSGKSGVGRIVLIQMSFYKFDNRYMLDTIGRFPGVFSGVAVVDENSPDLVDTMKSLAAGGVRGFRIHPAAQPVYQWIGSPGMQTLWRSAAEQDLAVCPLINPEALPVIERMCNRFSDTRVVIDHFARIGVDGNIRDEQVDALCRLAKYPNTYVKTSAFYALGKKQPPDTDLAPMIRRVRDAFGAERLMWASDCPYQVDPGHTYEESIALVRDKLDFLSADERKWMLAGTAEKVYFRGI